MIALFALVRNRQYLDKMLVRTAALQLFDLPEKLLFNNFNSSDSPSSSAMLCTKELHFKINANITSPIITENALDYSFKRIHYSGNNNTVNTQINKKENKRRGLITQERDDLSALHYILKD